MLPLMTRATPRKLKPKIIVEGTRLTHKTDLVFALQEHPEVTGRRAYRYHHPVVSAEWCTLTDEPWGRGIIDFEPEETAAALAGYDAWLALFRAHRHYAWLVDRFHLSTLAYQRAAGRPLDLASLDEALAGLGFCHVLCTRQEDSFPAAREARLRVSGKPSQYDDLAPFVREQADLVELAGRSRLPHLVVDVTDGDVGRVADEVVGWLTERRLLGSYDD